MGIFKKKKKINDRKRSANNIDNVEKDTLSDVDEIMTIIEEEVVPKIDEKIKNIKEETEQNKNKKGNKKKTIDKTK